MTQIHSKWKRPQWRLLIKMKLHRHSEAKLRRSEVWKKSHNEDFCSRGKSETVTLSQNLLGKVTPWRLPTLLAVCCVQQNFSVHITRFCSEQWGACINIPCPPHLWVFVLTDSNLHTHSVQYMQYREAVWWCHSSEHYWGVMGHG